MYLKFEIQFLRKSISNYVYFWGISSSQEGRSFKSHCHKRYLQSQINLTPASQVKEHFSISDAMRLSSFWTYLDHLLCSILSLLCTTFSSFSMNNDILWISLYSSLFSVNGIPFSSKLYPNSNNFSRCWFSISILSFASSSFDA